MASTVESRAGERTVDPRDSARAGGLIYVDADKPGLTRRRAGKGFSYRDHHDRLVTDAATLKRLRALAIPPAWSRAWICPSPQGHIQAVGYDTRGRKQYCYHPAFRAVRDEAKFKHLVAFAESLPALRRRVDDDMRTSGLTRAKVLATVVHLLEATMIRVGNAAYARENHSFGLTTLRTRHIKIDGSDLKFHFKGKSGRIWRLDVKDRRVANIIRKCQDLPGQNLFQYRLADGTVQVVNSADVNHYLREISGRDISAKDFRTWTATVLAASALAALEPCEGPARKQAVSLVVRDVAARLGNTPSICRQCYTHPAVIDGYLNGTLRLGLIKMDELEPIDEPPRLHAVEAAVLDFLRAPPRGAHRSVVSR